MLESEFDIQQSYNKFVNRIYAEVREKERKIADERVKEIEARIDERVKVAEEQKDEHYLTAIINNKAMTMDKYCSIFNISENEIKDLGYDALQKGLITKESASTFFDLPVDEVESQLKLFKK